MATLALASKDLEDLKALALLCLQVGVLDTDDAERIFEALVRVGAGLRAGRKWMRLIREGGDDGCEGDSDGGVAGDGRGRS